MKTWLISLLFGLIVTFICESNSSSSFSETPADFVPNIVHLIKIDDKFLSKMMFLNILSVLNQIKPTKLYIHTLSPPHGKYWERLSSYSQYIGIVEIRTIPEPIGLFGNFPEPNDFAHKSDCARMNILKSMGGIYLDLDVLVLHPFTDLLRYPMVLGKQYLKTLTVCNAVVIASKNSLFLQEWMEGYRQANFSTCWDCSSVQYPSNLLTNNEALRKATYILPVEAYYDPSFSRSDIRELFVENDKAPARLVAPFVDKYAQHLWHTVPLAKQFIHKHSLSSICNSTSIYNGMLRHALNGTKFLAEQCSFESK